jgi:para-aminobenzoate synthetase
VHTLIIDNYDSFTFNLFQALARVNGREPTVVRNDNVRLQDIESIDPDNIVISPGPGRPDRVGDFGMCADVLRRGNWPILGICLGCQGLATAFGGSVVQAPEPVHGRLSTISHDGTDLFDGLPSGFLAVRYHSLVVAEPLPDDLLCTARTADGLIMARRHRSLPLWGVQFHPESICTEQGDELLNNFRKLTRQCVALSSRPRQPPGLSGFTIVPHGASPPPADRPRRLLTRTVVSAATPEAVFTNRYARMPDAFWLDGEGGGRFSYLGGADANRGRVLRYRIATRQWTVRDGEAVSAVDTDCFAWLRQLLREGCAASSDLPFDLQGGLVGYLGYELKVECGGDAVHESAVPDAAFIAASRYHVYDHETRAYTLVALVDESGEQAAESWLECEAQALVDLPAVEPIGTGRRACTWTAGLDADAYCEAVRASQRLIAEGESYEICLTTQLRARCDTDPLAVYRVLRRRNPAPYAAYLRFSEVAILSSSPERFLRIDRVRNVETKPIKGTAPRGEDPETDARLLDSLRRSEKNRSENLMIVDLMRNDLGVVCEVGSVSVPSLMAIESYATVHQMVSTVCGKLRQDVDVLDCIRHAFPAGSMTGAPKRRTMAILDRLEPEARGIYSGAIGYLSFNGAADLGVVIRTAVLAAGEARIGCGGAVVSLSHPGEELAEIALKARAVQEALAATP